MSEGEYAVHFSQSFGDVDARSCAVLPSLTEAESFARKQVASHPTLLSRVFDHQGFIGAPAAEFAGKGYRGHNDITPRFRRWVGSLLFFGGSILFVTDWVANFRFDWPSVLGSRLMIPGLILLVTEALVMLHNRRKLAGLQYGSTAAAKR
ncbi:hypothetical protein SAMN05443244_2131 [Terriglobus roseus]|uniref:Uncharacterized protein n=2 Tax=Terriglobus roseus TaxID=392734 RepID=A0A1H4N549_9BACT|nr:hypothetical protein SAMN05443244_2131 [Terriglobus roseus]